MSIELLKEFLNEPEKFNIVIDDDRTGVFCFMRKDKTYNMDHQLKIYAGHMAGMIGQGADYTLKRYGKAWKQQLLEREK